MNGEKELLKAVNKRVNFQLSFSNKVAGMTY